MKHFYTGEGLGWVVVENGRPQEGVKECLLRKETCLGRVLE